MKLLVSAPGKTILHGEHAVVYGKAAVAMSLGLRMNLSLITHEENTIILYLKNLGIKKEWDISLVNSLKERFNCEAGDVFSVCENHIKSIADSEDVNTKTEEEKLAIIAFLYLLICIYKYCNNRSFTPCIITVDSELPVGSGMGSSASYSVCLSTAILILSGCIPPKLEPEHDEIINKWAFEAEKIFHGSPSGIDNSICTSGGALLFEKGAIVEKLPNISDAIHILLVGTRVSRNTKVLVANVKKKQQSHPSVIGPLMESIHAISKISWQVLKMSTIEEDTLKDLMNMNHHLLNCIGVGHPKLNLIHEIAQKYHCGSKLTGAGGGGCAIILLPFKGGEKASIISLKEELNSHDFDVWDIFLGCPGVQVSSE